MQPAPVIISAPRSGLNWVRMCIEFFCMTRTPGKPILIPKQNGDAVAFWRTHDAAGILNKTDRNWGQPITPEEASQHVVALLIRNPKELLGRFINNGHSKEKYLPWMDAFVGNLNVFSQVNNNAAKHFYYDDYVVSPKAMVEILSHLELKGRNGRPVKIRRIKQFWKPLGGLSRELYSSNHRSMGGAMTKSDPTNMSAHQSALRAEHEDQLVDVLSRLSPDARKLLKRYKLQF